MTQADPSSARRRPRLLGLAAPARTALIPPISAARWIILLIVLVSIYFFHGFLVPVPAIVAIGLWIAFQVVSQLVTDPAAGGVAYLAHIGGFAAGVVAGFLFRTLPERRAAGR